MKYLTGNPISLETKKDRESLIGVKVMYLRNCDIDSTGRQYFYVFPITDIIVEVKGKNLFFMSGSVLHTSDIHEMVSV